MPEKTDKRINPQVVELEIGIHNLRKIKIFPLSLADQIGMTDLITKGIQEFVKEGQMDKADIVFVSFLVGLIRENVGRVLDYVVDGEKGEDLIKEMSNLQSILIAEAIYDQNFGVIEKNVLNLSNKIKTLFRLERLPSKSVEPSQDINLNTSTEEATEKEESRLVK